MIYCRKMQTRKCRGQCFILQSVIPEARSPEIHITPKFANELACALFYLWIRQPTLYLEFFKFRVTNMCFKCFISFYFVRFPGYFASCHEHDESCERGKYYVSSFCLFVCLNFIFASIKFQQTLEPISGVRFLFLTQIYSDVSNKYFFLSSHFPYSIRYSICE